MKRQPYQNASFFLSGVGVAHSYPGPNSACQGVNIRYFGAKSCNELFLLIAGTALAFVARSSKR